MMKIKKGFIQAATGIAHTVKSEWNFKFHLSATVVVIIMGFYFGTTNPEWCLITGCCMLVLSMELINTAIENVCNLVTKDFHPQIKIIKDVAAGAVLVSAAGSAVIGMIIFLPKIINQIKIWL